MKYIQYDAYFGKSHEISEKEYKRKIKSKYVFRVWDSYYQEFTDTYYDSRDSITRIMAVADMVQCVTGVRITVTEDLV